MNCVSRWLQSTEHLGQSPGQTNVCHFKQWVSSRGNGISLPSQKFTKTLGLLFVYDKSPISGLYLAVVSHASMTISESHVPQDSDIWHHLTSLDITDTGDTTHCNVARSTFLNPSNLTSHDMSERGIRIVILCGALTRESVSFNLRKNDGSFSSKYWKIG